MFGRKIRLNDALYERLKATAAKKGYSSAEEFILHLLEQAASEADDSESEEAVRRRLKGLGYLDG